MTTRHPIPTFASTSLLALALAAPACSGDDGATGDGTTTGASTTGSTTDASTTGSTTAPGSTTADTEGSGGSTGPGAVCGNGVVEGDEACDDGNQDALDGCEPDCTPSSGKEIWTATYDGMGMEDAVMAAARLPDGRFLAVGWSQTASGFDTLLWFLNPDGTEDDAVVHDIGAVVDPGTSERTFGLVVFDDGSFAVAGHLEADPQNDDWDVFVRRYDATVNEVWTHTWGSMGGGADFARGLAYGPNDTYVVAGDTPGTNGTDGLLLALDEAGNEVFVTLYDGEDGKDDLFYGVAYDGNQIWVTGTADYDPPFDRSKWFVAGYDASGVQQWADVFAGSPDKFQRARGITTDADGKAYVTGRLGSQGGGDIDVWVVGYDPNGVRSWTALYDSPAALEDDGYGIARRDDGAVFVTGLSVAIGEQQNILMGRWDDGGTLGWTAFEDGDLSLTDVGTAVALDSDGYPVFFGYTTMAGESRNAWARKVYP